MKIKLYDEEVVQTKEEDIIDADDKGIFDMYTKIIIIIIMKQMKQMKQMMKHMKHMMK
jgi:hypothetical protein